MGVSAGKYRHRVRFERPVPDTSLDGAGSGSWAPVAEVAAEVQDALPSRAERLGEGINLASHPSRLRIRRRAGLDSSMRVLVGRNIRNGNGEIEWVTDRAAQIVSGPAERGNRDELEFMIEDYSSAGNAA